MQFSDSGFLARITVLLIVFTGLSKTATCQTDFFWSDKSLNAGAINAPLKLNGEVGEILTLYLYYTTNGPIDSNITDGAFLDVSMSTSGVAQFLSAETFDFDILVVQTPIFKRWGSGQKGGIGVVDVSPEFINEWFAFTITEPGIVETNNGTGVFLDEGYDSGADAFLWGAVEIQLLSNGTVDLVAERGDGGIADDSVALFPTFGSASISFPGCKLGILGDLNEDGEINLLDVGPFVDALLGNEYVLRADMNCDGQVNLLDVPIFIDVLTGN